VLILDIDGLKPINDRFGHRAGDAALREFGVRLQQVARKDDTVARLGGDEFASILQVEDRVGALAHVRRIEQAFDAAFAHEQQPIALSASIGAAIFPDDATELEALLDTADRAMYAVKRARTTRA